MSRISNAVPKKVVTVASVKPLALLPETQLRIMEDAAETLERILLNGHQLFDPKYLWRLKGAIRMLRGDNPDKRRG